MSRGQHAIHDGSFGRSAGSAMARGIALILAAVAVGVLVLRVAGDEHNFESDSQKRARLDSASATSSTLPSADPSSTTPAPTTPAPTPETTTVLVLNGSDTKGAAKGATEMLKTAAFKTMTPSDVKQKPAATAVYYMAGFDTMAQQIATKLGIAAKPLAMPTPAPADPAGAQVLVIIGADVAPKFAPA